MDNFIFILFCMLSLFCLVLMMILFFGWLGDLYG